MLCGNIMLPNATKTAQAGQAPTNSRRYSLFSSGSATRDNKSVHASLLVNLLRGHSRRGSLADKRGDFDRKVRANIFRSSANPDVDMSNCQRCKSIEVDLTTASDNLNATDAELKASRQVISLLQRQLELFQVEKDGLEKLIVSQSQDAATSLPKSIAITSSDNDANSSTSDSGAEPNGPANSGMQKKLMRLIQTQLYAKDEEIIRLKSSLKESQNEKEQIKLQVHMLEEDLAALKTENSLLKENLALRDQTIVSLSNEVFEQGSVANESTHFELPSPSRRRQSNVESLSSNQRDTIRTQRHIAKLVDTLEAYKKTNELLGTNITKLTERCAQAEKKEIEARSECQELEAKCCQIQSKLLSLLKEIEQSQGSPGEQRGVELAGVEIGAANQANVICSESVKSLIKRLLEDKSLDIPLSWKEGNRSKRKSDHPDAIKNSNLECDELGFYLTGSEKDDSLERSGNFERVSPSRSGFLSQLAPVEEGVEAFDNVDTHPAAESQRSVDGIKSDENNWRLRWDEFIKDFDKIDLSKSREFKHLVRSGIPQEYRCKIWKALVDLKVGSERQRYGSDYYQNLLEPSRAGSQSSKNKQQTPLDSASKQIELDLLRTLPNNKYFESIDSPGTIRLRKVLTAYARHNQQVAYCQGMNRLAAVALLVLPEEEAFWCLVAIVDKIMPTGYYNDLWLAQVDSNVIMDFVALKMPNLREHFKQYDIELSLFAWFLTIFVDGTPPALFLRLWDCFLYEGDKVMFRVALALLKMYENQLTTLNNSVAVNNFLRSAVNAPMNVDQFFEVAFEWINPLSGRLVRSKRQHHFKILRSSIKQSNRDLSATSTAPHHKNEVDEELTEKKSTTTTEKDSEQADALASDSQNFIDLSDETNHGGKVFSV